MENLTPKHQSTDNKKLEEHRKNSSINFITNETAYRQATKCPCPYQWKSNTPKYPGV